MEIRNMNAVPPEKVGESEIISRILQGEKELYEILIRRNNQKLFRVIRSYIRDTDEAQDIMQDTYLRAYEKLFQFREASTFSTWLVRIGINEALAHLRKKGKVFSLNTRTETFNGKSFLEVPDSSQMNPEKKIIRNEAKMLLENAIDNLDAKYRAVYILMEVEEMSTKQIAECLNISVSNVKVRHHRAKKMLKESLYQLTLNNSVFEFGNSRCDRLTERVMQLI